ncbi:MAG TPA: prepilin-type N-terminal cleavage/methylation domain-containing protein [Clostridiales bacterium]|mgnify:CR=1 FL=1|nr:prepilin-type N-terminal cleavage/methylation domain-containing protein [Clostridiales bacterium]
MKEQRKRLNDHGFSLVELIVVIAIIGVLVGAATPQVIKYIERSRVAADLNSADVIDSAIEMAITDEDAYKDLMSKFDGKNSITFDIEKNGFNFGSSELKETDPFIKEVKSILGELPKAKAKDRTEFKITITSKDDGNFSLNVRAN